MVLTRSRSFFPRRDFRIFFTHTERVRAAVSKFFHWEMFGVVCLFIALCFPNDTEHTTMLYVQATDEGRTMQNLVELEERLYEDIMKNLKNGHHDKAYSLAKDYLRHYTAGEHYFEVYRVFRSLRTPAAEK